MGRKGFMKPHGNSLKNKELHHLYEIIDKNTDEVFKYGISFGPINKDGTSKRMREQVRIANLAANEQRYFARIILTDIEGREEALRIEKEFIQGFYDKYDKFPRGNN